MQNQELFLITILKFPVIVIKFIAKVFSILTYLPNYLVLFLIDAILFHQYLQSTLTLYILSWMPRVLLLLSAGAVFTGEFYLIFEFMQLHQHGLTIQISGIILTLAGLLILMRKGYLTLLEKYNLTKLKSPIQHIQLGLHFFVDCIGIVLWLINCVLLINIGRSWSYKYDRTKKHQFIIHIFNLIRQSLITYLQFFYIKIFFRVCGWRFVLEAETYKKEKEGKNVLNCLVLLTLVYLMTWIDLIVVGLFGLPCVLHFQRKTYFEQMSSNHQKYKITFKMFGFVALHMLQFVIEVFCLTLCWSNGVKALKKWVNIKSKEELFRQQDFLNLVVEAMLKIPYLLSLLIITISIYKLKRRNYLLQKYNQSKQIPTQNNQHIWLTFSSFGQLLKDLLCYPLIITVTVIKPWKIWWLKYLIEKNYEMHRLLIGQYFLKSMVQCFTLPFTITASLIVFLYDFRKPLQLYREAGEDVHRVYISNVQQVGIAAPNPQLQALDSPLNYYFVKIVKNLIQDIPHLPYYFTLTCTFVNVYQSKLTPKTTSSLILLLQRTYFYLNAVKSIRSQQYESMFKRIKASGGLTTPKQQYRFWKYAYKCQRLLLIQKILSFFLPKKSVQNIKKRQEPQTRYSQIANFYWNNSYLAKKMAIRLLTLIIQIILTIFGIAVLLPLTLWRIPTFLKIFAYHRSKKYFFTILKHIYKQMFYDVITLPWKLITFILAPKIYIDFIIKTSFQYGPAGIDTFELYQRFKYKYFKFNVFQVGLVTLILHFKVMFIVSFWIRAKQLKNVLRHYQLTYYKLYRDIILIGPTVQPINLMMTQLDQSYLIQLLRINSSVTQIFSDALYDLPYLALMLFIFCTMPWRINYLIQTVKDMREDSTERKSFFKLVRNIFKDYACILMNIVLLLSIFKTKKALFLIRRNYRLNFFIGFLEYSYYRQLTNQMVGLGIIYKNVMLMVVAIMFGWTRSHLLINQLKSLRKKQREEQESAVANKKIYDNTVKSGKQLQTLHKMGYYNYISVCSFLTLPEIMELRQVDQFNYNMTQREQIWFMKWQLFYSKQSNQSGQRFEQLCKNAFIAQSSNRQKITYQTIIVKHFKSNVFEGNVDLAEFLRDKLPNKYYDALFKNYQFTFIQGYGPENQLPQQENQDEEFLRLTNQVRRPRVQLDEEHAWLHLLYVRKIQFAVRNITRYLRQDTRRRLKQSLLIAVLVSFVTLYLSFIWFLRGLIFRIDALMGIKIILTFYFHSLIYCFGVRCMYIIDQWVAIIPFDLYYDLVQFIKYVRKTISAYIIQPVVRFVKMCGNQIKKAWLYCYNFLERSAIKGFDLTVKYSLLAYDKIVKPLYIKIAEILRKVKDSIVAILTLIFQSIKAFLNLLKILVTSVYEGIRAIFSNINKLYYFILKSLMNFFLKFGVIGNLVFTIVGLVIMTLPSIIWWTFYHERWYLVVSTIHTMVLIVVGYRHLNRIRKQKQA